MKKSSARAPGKIILTGEHAVVYGMPAIAVAVNRYITTTVSSHGLRSVLFSLADLRYSETSTIDKLRKLKKRLKSSYDKFLKGDFHLSSVLEKPVELAQFAFINALDHVETSLDGLNLETHSDLPTGCGMGSSAALAVSITGAVLNYYDIQLSDNDFFELVKVAESMQHGYTKGLDVMTSYRGGGIYFHEGEYQSIALPNLSMCLLNTGLPVDHTGDVVTTVRERHGQSSIWKNFEVVTQKIHHALTGASFDVKTFYGLMADNHALLEEIGVVPDRVKSIVRDLKVEGITAKLCGAGSAGGDNGGLLLLLADDLTAVEVLAKRYGMNVIHSSIDYEGLLNVSS